MSPSSLRDAALGYAAQGFRVVPLHYPIHASTRGGGDVIHCSCGDRSCGSIGKHPRTPHGLNEATRDPARLDRWWRRWPKANIGLVTGEHADVLDVDGPAGQAAIRQWAAHHHLRLEGPLVRTGSGWHHYLAPSGTYLAPSGTGNRVGLLEHVDWRGRGGYVVAPPSQHPSGVGYRWLRPLTADLPELPAPLRHLLVPSRQAPTEATLRFRPAAAGHPYGRTALEHELVRVAQAPKGTRNHTLYQAGIRLYSLVAGGILNHAEVHTGLLAAAETSRLLSDEPAQTHRTLASAERTGLAHPRGVPAHNHARGLAPAASRARVPRRRDERERDG